MTIRKLAEEAEISHTQLGRIESGQVLSPSREVLVAIGQALGRNPLPLLVLSGELAQDEAREALAPMLREGAELPEEWGEWASMTLDEARALVRSPRPDEHTLRQLAADIFHVVETDETQWRPEDAMLAVRGAEQRQAISLFNAWRFIGPERRQRLLEYARALRRLEDLEYLAEVDRIQVDADSISAEGETQEPGRFSESGLRAEGFEGFVRIAGLPAGCRNVPPTPGVYVVVRRSSTPPTFLDDSVGGHFKGRDPTVDIERLEAKWIGKAALLYVGRTGNLRSRLDLLARFGRGDPVGHWGGRYLWQLADQDQLLVAWLETADEVAREGELLDEFHDAYGTLPFANLVRPGGGRSR